MLNLLKEAEIVKILLIVQLYLFAYTFITDLITFKLKAGNQHSYVDM